MKNHNEQTVVIKSEQMQINESQLFEDGLIRVYKTDAGELVVDGRELWQGLEVKTKFADWVVRRLEECDATENEDYSTLLKKENRQIMNDYIIKLDIAKEMAMLERNEKGKQYRKYLIAVDKKYKELMQNPCANLSPQLQLLINLELEQNKIKQSIADTNQRIDGISGIVALNTTNWREDAKKLISQIALAWGGYDYIREVNSQIYEQLNKRMSVNLKQRQTNKRQRMADEGICKSTRDKVTLVDVIATDKKLIEGYVAIVKEMAIKAGIESKGA